jgi:transposase
MGRKRPPFVRQVAEGHPRQTVEVWFQDEARVGQQGTLTRRWAVRGSRPTAVKQTEYEWVYLFAAVNPVTGDSSALLAPTVNTEYMNHHLRFISERVGPGVQVVLVLDQAGWHLSKDLHRPENITLLYLPAYSPELNPVERLWAFLRSHYLSNRAYENYNHLFDSCGKAWNQLTTERISSICHTKWIPPTK